MELELKVELRISSYKWSIDLVIPSHSGHLYDSRVLIIHLDFGLPPQDHVLACFGISTNETVPHAYQTMQVLLPRTPHGVPFHLSYHCETTPPPAATVSPPIVTTTDDTRLAEQEAREDVAHEFLTQFAFSADIDVSRRELEATRQRPDESISSFDLKSLVHATFSVEEAIVRGLWTDIAHFLDNKGKKPVGSSSRFGEVDTISYQNQRPAHHSPYKPPTVRAHFSHPQHQAFEKLKDAGVIVHLAPRLLSHPIPLYFRHDTEHCAALHHTIQDLIDSGLVDLSGSSVTTNPLPTHSTHIVPPPPSLQ
ncbi:hypothetical protein AAG906_011060 [Vitis piasezkii]